METVIKTFNYKEDGFNGMYQIATVSTEAEEFKNFLNECNDDTGIIFNTIKANIKNILIIKELEIEEKYQANGHGSNLIKEIIEKSNVKYVILVCDVTHCQRFRFILEKFYCLKNFKTIEIYQDFPLMLYPTEFANQIIQQIENNS